MCTHTRKLQILVSETVVKSTISIFRPKQKRNPCPHATDEAGTFRGSGPSLEKGWGVSHRNLSDTRAKMTGELGDRHTHLDRNGIFNATGAAWKPATPHTVPAQPAPEVPSPAPCGLLRRQTHPLLCPPCPATAQGEALKGGPAPPWRSGEPPLDVVGHGHTGPQLPAHAARSRTQPGQRHPNRTLRYGSSVAVIPLTLKITSV